MKLSELIEQLQQCQDYWGGDIDVTFYVTSPPSDEIRTEFCTFNTDDLFTLSVGQRVESVGYKIDLTRKQNWNVKFD